MYSDKDRKELINKALEYGEMLNELLENTKTSPEMAWDMLKLAITTKHLGQQYSNQLPMGINNIGGQQLTIELTPNTTDETDKGVTITADVGNPGGDNNIVTRKWAKGEQGEGYFRTGGRQLGPTFTVSSNAIYTVYVENSNGDKLLETIEISNIIEKSTTSRVALAKDDDFYTTENGHFRYIGEKTVVRIPHVIHGRAVTSYRAMFIRTGVTKVISDNKNIRDIDWMFAETTSKTLDLSEFYLPEVAQAPCMFLKSSITKGYAGTHREAEDLNRIAWDTIGDVFEQLPTE